MTQSSAFIHEESLLIGTAVDQRIGHALDARGSFVAALTVKVNETGDSAHFQSTGAASLSRLNSRITWAGFPPIKHAFGICFVTTAPAETIHRLPTSAMMIAPSPTHVFAPIVTRSKRVTSATLPSSSRCCRVPLGMLTRLPIITPSPMRAWPMTQYAPMDTREPTAAPRCVNNDPNPMCVCHEQRSRVP